MCGIAAILAYDPGAPPVEEGELVRMRECMSARGPDGAGLWTDPRRRVGLAHRRLAIIDLSPLGAQPMHVPERALAIVFNGEIYNYRELRAGLESRGHRFVSTSDTEVLLRLYAEHGEAMLPMLRGMFAFALWDGQKRGLLLARDPFGIKPLYVADDGKTLRAASQVKALLAGGQVSRRPDPAGHVGFFLWGHVPEPHTLFQGIRSLPAGTTLWCEEAGRRREQTFCSIPDVLREATGRVGHELPDWAEALRDSVRQHLVADVPVGVFLSSGVDSATVTTLASEQGGDLRTVTLGFEEFRGTPNDETPLAERLARELGTKHQTVRVTRRDFEAHVERLFDAMDQPSINGVNTYFVSFAAAQASLKVALSGLGGDELFGGYPSFRKIPQAVRTLRWFDVARVQRFGRLFRLVMAPVLKHVTSPKYAGLLEYGGRSSSAYLLHRCLFMPWELPNLLDADMVRAGWRELEPLARLEMTVAGLASAHARVSALELCWYMRNQLLRDSDWASMAHSVEIRVPYVDVPLLRALAPRLVGLAPPTKRDLAGVPSRPLPSEILNRPKTGFQIPVREWLMAGRTTGQWDNKTPGQPDNKTQGQRAEQTTAWGTVGGGERGLRGWAKVVYARFVA